MGIGDILVSGAVVLACSLLVLQQWRMFKEAKQTKQRIRRRVSDITHLVANAEEESSDYFEGKQVMLDGKLGTITRYRPSESDTPADSLGRSV